MTELIKYSFYFKLSNREMPIMYTFHSDVTINYFIEFIRDEMSYLSPKNTNIIEIFEILQDNIEIKNKLNYLESYTLKEVFGDRWKETSFYVKFM